MLKNSSVPLSLLGNLVKRVSHIDTQDWDSLKLATALKVTFCPEVGDYHEVNQTFCKCLLNRVHAIEILLLM
jgi:hypothetical protein